MTKSKALTEIGVLLEIDKTDNFSTKHALALNLPFEYWLRWCKLSMTSRQMFVYLLHKQGGFS